MPSQSFPQRSISWAAVLVLFVLSVFEVGAAAGGRLVEHRVEGKALTGNLLGVSAERNVAVYLPPSYDRSKKQRYPSLYLLHGILDPYTVWTRPWDAQNPGFDTVQALMDRGTEAGLIQEMIVVIPDSEKSCHYTNSPVKGAWEDFIVHDLVSFIDGTYRTINCAASRGIAGHSMGGHGAIKIGMRHAETFSAVYGLNPSLLGWGGDVTPDNPSFAGLSAIQSPEDLEGANFYIQALVGIGQCFSPNTDGAFLTDLPFFEPADGDGVAPGPGFERWQGEMPLHMIEGHLNGLRALKGLRFDSAFVDEYSHIPITAQQFSQALTEAGVAHTFEMYNGDHRNRLWGEEGRLYTELLPWFSRRLDGEGDPGRKTGRARTAKKPRVSPGKAQTVLWEAAKSGDVDRAAAALEAGADLDALDTRTERNGRRALNWAAWHDQAAMVRWLVERGADINLANTSGFTPLHHAAEAGAMAAARTLLTLGADPGATNRFDHTPSDTASRMGHEAIAELLQQGQESG